MNLRTALMLLRREFSFELKYPSDDPKLELAVAVISHLRQMPIGTFFWEPISETEGRITLNWDVTYGYRVVNCRRQGEGSCYCNVVLEDLGID